MGELRYSATRSDLYKVHDVLVAAWEFHQHRDKMNGAVHLAKETRYSPLTSQLSTELDRVKSWIELAK